MNNDVTEKFLQRVKETHNFHSHQNEHEHVIEKNRHYVYGHHRSIPVPIQFRIRTNSSFNQQTLENQVSHPDFKTN